MTRSKTDDGIFVKLTVSEFNKRYTKEEKAARIPKALEVLGEFRKHFPDCKLVYVSENGMEVGEQLPGHKVNLPTPQTKEEQLLKILDAHRQSKVRKK